MSQVLRYLIMKKLQLLLAVLLSFFVGFIAHDMMQPQASHAQGAANAQYLYIVTAVTTTVDAQAGFLQTVTINGGVAGTITLYDIAGTGCTGTPASGKFAVIEAIGATNPTTLIYNLKTKNGLCIVTAAATDITVTYN